MNDQDRQAIEQLFQKLRQVEGRTGPRDPEAEALIRQRLGEQPGAAYYLAQTVIMQELALETANRRIEEFERQGQGGGFLSGLFGGGRQPPRADDRHSPREAYPPQRRGPWNQAGNQPAGGGFLAGAAQTAMGVAGGVVLGNLLAGALFGGGGDAGGTDTASAADSGQDTADASPDAGDGDFGGDGFDTAGDFGDFGDFG